MKKVVIFIDDTRDIKNYVDCTNCNGYQATDYNKFIYLLNSLYESYGQIDEIWFDHDLGEFSLSGYDCAKYLVSFCINHNMKLPSWHIQSSNPAGRKNIDSYLKSYLKSLDL